MKANFIAIVATMATAVATAIVPFSAQAAEVEFHTTHGLMVFDIDEENAPATAANFIQYVEDGFFDDLIFHRVIPGFVIQGGGFNKKMKQKDTRAPIINEADNGRLNKKYTLSMARTSDPNSATSQFFINLGDNVPLDKAAGNPGYAVFGEVIEGQDVVDDIGKIITGTVGHFRDVPAETIIITKAIVR